MRRFTETRLVVALVLLTIGLVVAFQGCDNFITNLLAR